MNNEIDGSHNYLDLATSHITQYTSGSEKTDWSVELNESNEKIFTLPKILNETQIFNIMDFAKAYELEAFNRGIKFQKNKQNKVLQLVISNQRDNIKILEHENNRLANILESLIGDNEDV